MALDGSAGTQKSKVERGEQNNKMHWFLDYGLFIHACFHILLLTRGKQNLLSFSNKALFFRDPKRDIQYQWKYMKHTIEASGAEHCHAAFWKIVVLKALVQFCWVDYHQHLGAEYSPEKDTRQVVRLCPLAMT